LDGKFENMKRKMYPHVTGDDASQQEQVEEAIS
jgi:hypothetical protein